MRSILLSFILAVSASPEGAAPQRTVYQVVGKVLLSDGTPFRGVTPVVFLHGAITPFSRQTPAGPDGKFRFKSIPPGTYMLVAAVPRAGEIRRTVEVGPGFADSKGIVAAGITFDRTLPINRRAGISAVELSVTEQAILEYTRAQDCLARQDVNGAVERLNKAVEISPGYATAWNQLGTIAYQTRRYQDAERYFREALKQDPEAYAPLVNLGGALLALNRIEESLAVNQAAVKASPGDALAHSQLGKSYFYLGKFDDAETYLKRAEAIDPSHFSYPQVILAEIYMRRNQVPAAMAEMEEFLKLHPDSDWAPGIRKALETARSRLPVKQDPP
jgi:Tfp pilus assembly protein PilF